MQVEQPKVVVTSENSARIYFVIGAFFFIMVVGWLYIALQPAHDGNNGYSTLVHFILTFFLSIICYAIYRSNIQPNLFLYQDRLVIYSYHLKGEIQLSNITYLVTGYDLSLERMPSNQARCLNDSLSSKNKILFILVTPTRFTHPLGWAEVVSEVVLGVKDVDMFVWDIILRNPEVEVFNLSSKEMVYERGVFAYEPVCVRPS